MTFFRSPTPKMHATLFIVAVGIPLTAISSPIPPPRRDKQQANNRSTTESYCTEEFGAEN